MHVITANRLTDGRVVYLDDAGGWTVALNAARFVGTEDAANAALAEGQAAVARQEVVDPYTVLVVEGQDGWAPRSLRERIRAFGPTAQAADVVGA
jgi:hypothetical protein